MALTTGVASAVEGTSENRHPSFHVRGEGASFVEWLDEFEECAVRILEAKELGAGPVGESHGHRFRNHLDTIGLQTSIFTFDVFGEQRDARDAGVVEMRIRSSLRRGLLPFD